MYQLSASLMCADFLHLSDDLNQLKLADVNFLHIDIMDGHFVPNLCLNFDLLRQVSDDCDLPLDVHLMVDNPEYYLEQAAALGAQMLSFHIEAVPFPLRLIRKIKALGMRAGVAYNPSTDIQEIRYIIDELDFALIMTVEPGFAGQKFIPSALSKIQYVKDLRPEISIQVDGNITPVHAATCIQMGCDNLVGGTSSVFKQGMSRLDSCEQFRRQVHEILVSGRL